MAIPPIGVLFWKQRLVVKTDRNVYVTLGASKPGRVEDKYALDQVQIATGKKRLGMLALHVGPRTVWAPMAERGAAQALAGGAAAGPAPPAATQQ